MSDEPTRKTESGIHRNRPRRTDIGQLFDVLQPTADTRAKTISNSLEMAFVLVPAGTFWMGSTPEERGHRANEAPRHEVVLTQSFYLAVHPVSQRAYEAVMGNNPSRYLGELQPVENVNWHEAIQFCERLIAREPTRRYRLPTEAEWEYACRSGSETAYTFGDALLDSHARFGRGVQEHHVEGPKKQGSFPTNSFGIADMHGNIWEWVQDWYLERAYNQTALRDPAGPSTGTARVLRGGSWMNSPERCRAAYRNALEPHQRDSCTGFRIVLEPLEPNTAHGPPG